MTPKYTTGPWYFSPYYRSAEYRRKLAPDFYYLTTNAGSNYGQAIATANSEQDARLVAASPEMLEALNLCHAVLWNGYKPDSAAATEARTATLKAIEKATTGKATGEKP